MADNNDLQIRELAHRFKNLLTITRSIVSQTLRSATSIEDAREAIDRRLAAMDGAMRLLLSTEGPPPTLEALANQALAPFRHMGDVRLEGPPTTIGPNTAMTLILALHELATNATKYGALSEGAGTIELTWKVLESRDAAELWIQWAERGGPPVTRPDRQGFGSRLICTAAARSVRGRAELDFPSTGVIWTLLAPLAALAE